MKRLLIGVLLRDTQEHEPLVSVVIPCRNEVGHIAACLEAVLAFDYPRVEVIVSDGMSEDGTRDIVEQYASRDARVRLIDNLERKTPHALNVGIVASRGTVIARIDAHSTYENDYLSKCVDALLTTDAANVGGPWVAVGNNGMQASIAAAFASPFAVGGARGHSGDYEGPVDTVYLGCWNRQTLIDAGMFDEEFVRNQDDELNLRLTSCGGTVWQSPSIRSYYTPRGDLGSLWRQYFQYGYWKVKILAKHRRVASVRHLGPAGFLVATAALSLASLASPLALWTLAGLLSSYLAAVVVASGVTASAHSEARFAHLLAIFPYFHFSYGFGFLIGIWDFLIMGSTGRFTTITRRAAR